MGCRQIFPSAAQILHRKGPQMAPAAKKQTSENWLQRELLDKLVEVKKLVDESLKLNRENGEDIRTLRKELGVDGAHGRLPQIDQAIARLDRQQEDDHKEVCSLITANAEKTERRFDDVAKKMHDNNNKLLARVEPLERGEHETSGKNQMWEMVRNLLTSSAAAALIGVVAKMLGLIH